MARKPVELNPRVQQRLLEQMREEQAASIRRKQIRNVILVPTVLFMTVVGLVMTFSDDQTMSMIGSTFASSILLLLWKLRKRFSGGD